jgi:hypothetical protein
MSIITGGNIKTEKISGVAPLQTNQMNFNEMQDMIEVKTSNKYALG